MFVYPCCFSLRSPPSHSRLMLSSHRAAERVAHIGVHSETDHIFIHTGSNYLLKDIHMNIYIYMCWPRVNSPVLTGLLLVPFSGHSWIWLGWARSSKPQTSSQTRWWKVSLDTGLQGVTMNEMVSWRPVANIWLYCLACILELSCYQGHQSIPEIMVDKCPVFRTYTIIIQSKQEAWDCCHFTLGVRTLK